MKSSSNCRYVQYCIERDRGITCTNYEQVPKTYEEMSNDAKQFGHWTPHPRKVQRIYGAKHE